MLFYILLYTSCAQTIWLAFDAKYFKVELLEEALMEGQELVFTSPIWLYAIN